MRIGQEQGCPGRWDGRVMQAIYDEYGEKTAYLDIIKELGIGKDVIVAESNLETLFQFLIKMVEIGDQSVLIVGGTRTVASIYERLEGTERVSIGLFTTRDRIGDERNYICAHRNVAFEVDATKFRISVLVLDEKYLPPEYISRLVGHLCRENTQMVVYRVGEFDGLCKGTIVPLLIHGAACISGIIRDTLPGTEKAVEGRKIRICDCLNAVFDDCLEAVHMIRKAAAEDGFEIISKDALSSQSRRIRLYCKQRCCTTKIPERTRKCGCSFEIVLSRLFPGTRYKVTKMNNKHDHELYPSDTRYLLLNSHQIQLIQTMKKSKISNSMINRVMSDLYAEDFCLTKRQIRVLMKGTMKGRVHVMETEELRQATVSKGGECYIKTELDHEGKSMRTAILCFDTFEVSRITKARGDVLFIDGTQVSNKLKWECTPITMVDDNLALQSAGTLFSVKSTAEVYAWFLQILRTILERREPEKQGTVTIITDEDLALCSAIETCSGESQLFNHVICSWHKSRNFEKELMKCGLNPDERKWASALFQRICRSPKKSVVDEAVRTLQKHENQGLQSYMKEHVIPLLRKFSRAYIPCFTAGYNVSSLSESTNALIKSGMGNCNYTLLEIRDLIRKAFYRKNVAAYERELHRFPRTSDFLWKEFRVKVPPRIEEMLIGSVLKAVRLVESAPGHYKDPKHPGEDFQVTWPDCECGKLRYAGLPCSHIIRYGLDHDENPMMLINRRFRPDFDRVYMQITKPAVERWSIWRPELCERYNNTKSMIDKIKETDVFLARNVRDRNEEEESEDDLPSVPSIGEGEDPTGRVQGDARKATSRFNSIMRLAREVARHASVSDDMTSNIMHMLESQLTGIVERQGDAITEYDAQGQGKGRPRRSRISAAYERRTRVTCKVCQLLGFPAQHNPLNCRHRRRVAEIGNEADRAYEGSAHTRCRICGCRGHNSKRCLSLSQYQYERIVKQK